MRKLFAVIAVVAVLALPVGAQSIDFLVNLMKAVVEEYGIETVIGVLEDLGYIGGGRPCCKGSLRNARAENLTVNS